MHFLLIVTGYNCADNVRKCYNSIAMQTEDYTAVFIDDGSEDGTEKAFGHRDNCKFEIYPDNMGAAYRRFYAIRQYANPDDIIVLIGMDDMLMEGALTKIREQYENGKLMTYGMWQYPDGRKLSDKFTLDFDSHTHSTRNYRKRRYRSTAPNTFKAFLFNYFTEKDFMVDGKWIKATTESPLMFGLMEICGKRRIGIIYEPIYIYNRSETNNARARFGDAYQDEIFRQIKKRHKKPFYDESQPRPMAPSNTESH